MATEMGPVERELVLARLLRGVGRAARRGDVVEFGRLSAEYERLKGVYADLSRREQREATRARGAAEGPVGMQGRPVVRPGLVPWSRWRHGRSPGAEQRDRLPAEPVKPQVPHGGHLSPWRRGGSAASEQIWRP